MFESHTIPSADECNGSFALVLHSHIPYVLAHGHSPHGTDWLSEVTAECYVPLLDVFHRLIDEGVSPRVTIGLTPILVEQLSDETFVGEFEDYCDQKIAATRDNAREFRQMGRPDMAMLADFWHGFYSRNKDLFCNTFNRNLVAAFKALQDAGHIEVLTSAATHAYFPLLGTDIAIDAQVKQGIANYRRHFGREPRGFWLPECAYRPSYHWQPPIAAFQTPEPVLRKGIEEFLAGNGLEYFFVDAHLIKGGAAIGVYAERFKALEALWSQFQKEYQPESGERSPHQTYLINSSAKPLAPVAVFARDHETGIQVWSGEVGYPGDEWYLEFHRKHYPGNLRYWRVSWPREDLGRKDLYEPVRALSRLPEHARNFAEVVCGVLNEANDEHNVITSMYDTELFGHWWFEGPEFLYYAIRALNDAGVNRVTCGQHLDAHPPNRVISLPEGSWGEGGYHWIWLNEWTTWTWELIYRAERDLTELVNQFGDDPRVSTLLKQAARELLLLESSDWEFCISTWAARDYAEQRAKDHAAKFKAIANLVRRVAAGEEIPHDDWNALGEAEDRDRCFPGIDPKWWSNGETTNDTNEP